LAAPITLMGAWVPGCSRFARARARYEWQLCLQCYQVQIDFALKMGQRVQIKKASQSILPQCDGIRTGWRDKSSRPLYEKVSERQVEAEMFAHTVANPH
jgi:hypothetical protein